MLYDPLVRGGDVYVTEPIYRALAQADEMFSRSNIVVIAAAARHQVVRETEFQLQRLREPYVNLTAIAAKPISPY